jgi:DNA-directed RNA polymerase subunit RPC12/RpoP
MLELCEALHISVNDLLCGEVVIMDNYNKEMEKNLLEMIRQKEESDKRLLTIEWVVGILSTIVIIAPIICAGLLPIEDWQRLVLIFSGFIPGLAGVCVTLKIEQVAGYYQCKECGHRYVPSYKAINMAPHMGRTRYMRCPHCDQKSWQKKVISKE